MSNNIPFYPLLRREVDIVVALDTSADIQTTPWFERTDGYAKQKGIVGWPIGVGWPKDTTPSENLDALDKATASSPKEVETSLAEAKGSPQPDEPADPITRKYGLGHCNIWIGTTAERTSSDEPPPPKQMPLTIDDAWRLDPNDGIMLIYLPLLPNDKVPGVIPETTEYMSTWNFAYTPEQVDKVVELAQRNFEIGEERIRRAVRAVWERKREIRRKRELDGRLVIKGKTLVTDTIEALRR
jgi:cytosolic phospholipase A2